MLDLYERQLKSTEGVVAGISPDQFGDPTPCTEWNVEKVLDHLIGGLMTFAAGDTAGGSDAIGGSGHAASGHVEAYRKAADDALATFQAPGALEGPLHFPWGDTPGAMALGLALADATVHGWDLATATGQKYEIDTDIAESVLGVVSMMEPKGEWPRGDNFKAPVEIPADAPAADQLIAYLGRQP